VNESKKLRSLAEKNEINFYFEGDTVRISINENTSIQNLQQIINVFEEFTGKKSTKAYSIVKIDNLFARESAILTHPIFNTHHSRNENDALHQGSGG
jgi:glycine dehydrogenase